MEKELKLHELLYPLGLLEVVNGMRADIAKKPNAVDGKGFSTNDFTDECAEAVNGSVRFDAEQELTAAQRATAVKNIGGDKVLSTNDFTNACLTAVNGSVRFDAEQELSAAQRATAVKNIGGDKVLSTNDFTDECAEVVSGAVRFDAEQELTAAQRATVLNNIGALSAENYSSESADALFLFTQELKSKISVWISVDETSPAQLFGGTWERISGRFLLAASEAYPVNSVGGSKDAVIVSHTHNIETVYSGSGGISDGKGTVVQKGYAGEIYGNASTTQNNSKITSTGISGVDKNMPPYVAVHIWKRVA